MIDLTEENINEETAVKHDRERIKQLIESRMDSLIAYRKRHNYHLEVLKQHLLFLIDNSNYVKTGNKKKK